MAATSAHPVGHAVKRAMTCLSLWPAMSRCPRLPASGRAHATATAARQWAGSRPGLLAAAEVALE